MIGPPEEPMLGEPAPLGDGGPDAIFAAPPAPPVLVLSISQAAAAQESARRDASSMSPLRDSDGACIAETREGTRCTNARKHGDPRLCHSSSRPPRSPRSHPGPKVRCHHNDDQFASDVPGGAPPGEPAYFCAQHAKQATSAKVRKKTASAFSQALTHATRNWAVASDREQMEEAIRRSLADKDGGFHKRQERSRAILEPRLLEQGRVRLETAPFGNCRFIAVASSSGGRCPTSI